MVCRNCGEFAQCGTHNYRAGVCWVYVRVQTVAGWRRYQTGFPLWSDACVRSVGGVGKGSWCAAHRTKITQRPGLSEFGAVVVVVCFR